MKIFAIITLFIGAISYAKTEYSVENISLSNQQRSFSNQRSIIRYQKTREINDSFEFDILGNLIYSTINSNDDLGVEQAAPFAVELLRFRFVKSFNEYFQASVGFDHAAANSLSTIQTTGPGVGMRVGSQSSHLSTNFLTLPSQQRYFLAKRSDNIANLWSSSFKQALWINGVSLYLNYSYFHNLGPETSFAARFRGNSVVGVQQITDFEYDFSLAGAKLEYSFEYYGYEMLSFVEYSNNLGAFTGESELYHLGLNITDRKNTFALELLEVQSNSMIAIFTPEILYETNKRGLVFRYNRRIDTALLTNVNVGQFEDILTGEDQSSVQLGLSYEI